MHHSYSNPSKLRLSSAGLERVDATLTQIGWRKQSKEWAAAANVGVATLKRFRTRHRIMADAFQSICGALDLDWREIAEPCSPSEKDEEEEAGENLTLLDTTPEEIWVQRQEVLQQLVHRLQQGCRVLVITGITGIGKTVLTEQVSQHLQDSIRQQIHLNFEVRSRAKFVDIATHCLERAGQRVTEADQQKPQQLMGRWLGVLAHEPHWVVMDSVETILKGDEQKGWSVFEDPLWETFFHKLLGWETFQSQFLLTSQDLPVQIEVQGLRYKERFHVEPLYGLSPDLQAELFQSYGFEPDGSHSEVESWAYLTRIGAAYEGHPLALQVIIGEILDLYDGDAIAYWHRYGQEIKMVEAAQAASSQTDRPQLDRYSQRLRRAVRDRIERSFLRLRQELPDAYLLLCMAAIYREPVTERFLLSPMRRRGWSLQRGQVALDTLLDRHLLELGKQETLRQHNLIRSVALDHFHQLEQPRR